MADKKYKDINSRQISELIQVPSIHLGAWKYYCENYS